MTRILLIEDNEQIRDNAQEILQLANYEVAVAANGKEGYAQALTFNPDLIICDIMMPVLDGYGLLHLINKHEQLKAIPFIFLTAKTDRADFRKGMELGADDYITKPFTDLELMTAIESRLKKSSFIKQRLGDILIQEDFEAALSGQDTLLQLTVSETMSSFKKKQRIYGEGSYPHGLFYLVSGKVRTYKSNENGKELTTNLYTSGDFFGYNALIENTAYKESAETLENSEVNIISREDFTSLIQNNKEVAGRFIKLLARNNTEKESQLISLAYNSLRKRVADAIMTLYNKYKEAGQSDFVIYMSREDLARIAGTTTESLIRTLADFKSEKLIEAEVGYVKVLNEQKLKSLLN
ncbi:cAMP-binding domain of CRP or a regulatory subunit of cAMP-dependent protein kinases [Arachidicoccus rhizosphaerae]|uniref:cAMP-binding domain of CRP or a regulatory subunit of cAMP-dependent protein kinases n=1 Tax=Arachidicoccus rhizosphaerae TaxID=551991 RepID=A0A1H4BA30_9BACT|nr:response regulator [Arachidicoccus rhizosphaerae]SEA44967.1 cAMP-binding domain of CRP or a regulatory subunit of cAMP-dependent protein kinases [Arachidicoccus rhizosphaerae]